VTLPWESMASRVATSLSLAAGTGPALISRNFEDYYSVALAAVRGGRARLEKLRGSLSVMSSPAFDSRRWGRSYVQGLKMMWDHNLQATHRSHMVVTEAEKQKEHKTPATPHPETSGGPGTMAGGVVGGGRQASGEGFQVAAPRAGPKFGPRGVGAVGSASGQAGGENGRVEGGVRGQVRGEASHSQTPVFSIKATSHVHSHTPPRPSASAAAATTSSKSTKYKAPPAFPSQASRSRPKVPAFSGDQKSTPPPPPPPPSSAGGGWTIPSRRSSSRANAPTSPQPPPPPPPPPPPSSGKGPSWGPEGGGGGGQRIKVHSW